MKNMYRKSNEDQITLIKSEDFFQPLQLPAGLNLGAESDPQAIWLSTEVYPDTIATVVQQINNINYVDNQKEKEAALSGQAYIRHPIKLYISSYGGSVYDGLGLVGVIRSSKTPVHTYTFGKVMSMGFILAISGHKRFTYPHTTYMFHSLSAAHWGKFSELEESVLEDGRLQAKLDGITTTYTAIEQSRLDDIHSRKLDWYIDVDDALALGCVDGVL